MTDQDSNTIGQAPTHRKRFAEACKITDFASDPKMIGGYVVWGVNHIVKVGRDGIDGPYYTEQEAAIAADLLKAINPFAKEYASTHCSAWNPDPRREKATRDDAMASRMLLAMQIGAEVPTQVTNGK
ncbi:hypothetical protein [Pseudomonas reactans]|uniref:hypothetical protein n=1 Tax=Pseudomonas reactans TaxID=117680 RepID=UPI0015A22ED4|nr:hypothetical protein [Pseudomonas reactans]NWA65533.1 hypothetical protein [Pseudomonas reactans]